MTTAVGVLAAIALLAQAPSPAPNPPQEPGPESVVEEVLDNIRSQPLGSGTVDDLNLPEPFLRRVAGRVICASYEERFRIVVEEETAPVNPFAPGEGNDIRRIPSAWAIGGMVFVLCAAGFVGVLLKRRKSGDGS